MGINLHEEREPSREIDSSDVSLMRNKMLHHSEETNELYNLMARHIKKRCEERINLYTVESSPSQIPPRPATVVNKQLGGPK